jgi:hypothetical protein
VVEELHLDVEKRSCGVTLGGIGFCAVTIQFHVERNIFERIMQRVIDFKQLVVGIGLQSIIEIINPTQGTYEATFDNEIGG